MRRQRPGWVTALGVLQLVFAALELCSALGEFALVGVQKLLYPRHPRLAAYQAMLDREIPTYIPFQLLDGVVCLVGSAVLLASGYGLLKMRPWARPLTIAYAAFSLVYMASALTYHVLVILPAMEKVAAAFNVPVLTTLIWAMLAWGTLLLAFPVVVLALMLRPSARQAFADWPLVAEPAGPDGLLTAVADEGRPPGPPEDRFTR